MQADYISHMGDDLTVVNAARVSFDKESDWDSYALDVLGYSIPGFEVLSSRDEKLIKYLATHGHWTPFAHPQITLRETVPIFVARQRFKHMVGFVYNEVSRRYVDTEPAFYIPDAWRSRPDGSIKQGSGDTISRQNQDYFYEYYSRVMEFCSECYTQMVSSGIAPEQARMVLPQSMYTSYYVTGSLAAWARAYKQRIDSHAQQEIQTLAKQWSDIIQPLYPTSWEALIE